MTVWDQYTSLIVNGLLFGGLLALAIYAGWKAFKWLRKWKV